ncbi:RidA family protein, partial [Haloarcula hispanica]
MKRVVSTDEAPAAVGAYSQATTNGDLLITAGQLPLTTDGELLDDEPVADQTRQCL